jgi:hypothetical protein
MSDTNNIGKRLFADFLAARIKAKRIVTDRPQEASQTTPPRTEGDLAQMASDPDPRSRENHPVERAHHPLGEPGSSK